MGLKPNYVPVQLCCTKKKSETLFEYGSLWDLTRFIYDQFSKDYLTVLLRSHGVVLVSKKVGGEIREIDCYFVPNSPILPPELGILGQLATTPSLFEPYRNAVELQEIKDCILKLLIVSAQLRREARRNQEPLSDSGLPQLWIITPTASDDIVDNFGASESPSSIQGIYYLPTALQTALIVVHELPSNQDTLWLRLLGRGEVQKQAIDELVNLPDNHPLKSAILEILYNLQQHLEIKRQSQAIEEDDQELIMQLKPLYQQDRAQAKLEGKLEAEINLILRLLTKKFGNIDSQINQQITQLSVEKLEALAEALLDFNNSEDLATWLRDNC